VKNIDHVLSPLIWKISQIIVYIFFIVVNAYVLYQPMGIDYFPMPCIAITMALKLRKKLEQHPFMANLMEDDMAIALKLFM